MGEASGQHSEHANLVGQVWAGKEFAAGRLMQTFQYFARDSHVNTNQSSETANATVETGTGPRSNGHRVIF